MEMYENSIIKYSILLENMIEFSKTQVLKVLPSIKSLVAPKNFDLWPFNQKIRIWKISKKIWGEKDWRKGALSFFHFS